MTIPPTSSHSSPPREEIIHDIIVDKPEQEYEGEREPELTLISALDPSSQAYLNADLALRRQRGEVACAECRRLKIRCDRGLPCGSCVRRECSSLCPLGTNTTGEGTRFVLAATEHLHNEIGALRERVHVLEMALGGLHGARTGGPHPLLLPGAEAEVDAMEEARQINDEIRAAVEFEGLTMEDVIAMNAAHAADPPDMYNLLEQGKSDGATYFTVGAVSPIRYRISRYSSLCSRT
jgi:hypothetical protein